MRVGVVIRIGTGCLGTILCVRTSRKGARISLSATVKLSASASSSVSAGGDDLNICVADAIVITNCGHDCNSSACVRVITRHVCDCASGYDYIYDYSSAIASPYPYPILNDHGNITTHHDYVDAYCVNFYYDYDYDYAYALPFLPSHAHAYTPRAPHVPYPHATPSLYTNCTPARRN